MAAQETNEPHISFDEDDKRPFVESYGKSQEPKFSVGDKVYWQSSKGREGPFVVATVASGKYTLSLENGKAVNNGEEIDMEDLESA